MMSQAVVRDTKTDRYRIGERSYSRSQSEARAVSFLVTDVVCTDRSTAPSIGHYIHFHH
jgi:hypothetical protein